MADGLTKVGSNALQLCISLILAHLPETLFTIETNTFANCTQLNEIECDVDVSRIVTFKHQ